MPGFTNTEARDTLDARFPTTGASDYIAWSTDGEDETDILARTAVGATGWASATNADPAVKANAAVLNTAPATGGGTITHYAIFDADEAGMQRTEWTAVDTPRTLTAGDNLSAAVGALKITLT